MIRGSVPFLLLAAVAACGGGDSGQLADMDAPRGFEPPVATNAESPVRYPPALFAEAVEGTVILRLFVDEAGAIVSDSTRVAESSGNTAFDSAAVAGVARMVFAPARRDGTPVATAFLQPVYFRHPDGANPGGS